MRCPVCGLENDETRSFCARCAEELIPGAAAELEPPRARGPAPPASWRQGGRARGPREALASWRRAVRAAQVRPRSRLGPRFRHALLVIAAGFPGLAHLILGEWCLGVLLLGGVAVVAFTGPRGAYSPGAALATALLFGLIFVSLLDIVRFEPASRRRSAVTGWDVVIALALALPAYGLMAALLNALVLRLY